MTTAKQPNIIFLMTDQHRWDALGCQNPLVKTPNLDKLCAAGVRFDQAVCNAPMCVPSRYSMMTGLYASQCGVRHNTQMCVNDSLLEAPTIAERLGELGYQTIGFGKTHWYIGNRLTPEAKVETSRRGFDVRYSARPVDESINEPDEVTMGRTHAADYEAVSTENKQFGPGGEDTSGYVGITSTVEPHQTREGWLTQQLLEWLDSGQRNTERPLMLYLSFDFPHPGFNPPAKYEQLYNIDDIPDQPLPPWSDHPTAHVGRDRRANDWNKLTSEQRRRSILRYYALCSFVDDLFGRVLDKLQSQGELDNSLIIFTSDHGEMLGERRHHFSKYCLYEGSVRVPMVLSGSCVAENIRGTIDSRPAELVDLLPTIVKCAGGDDLPQLPGGDLLGTPRRIASFCEMHGSGYGPNEIAPALMWRTQDWKLILCIPGELSGAEMRLDSGIGELYDLKNDPQEFNNLYGDDAHRDIRERMTRELLMHLACQHARWPRKYSRPNLEI